MPDPNKELVRRLFEDVLTQGRTDAVDEVLAQDYVGSLPFVQEPVRGLEVYKMFLAKIQTGFPDGRAMVDEQIAEGDQVLTRFTLYGTHTGPFAGIPATHKRVTLTGMVLHKVANGKVISGRVELNLLSLFEQLNLVPHRMTAVAGA